MERDIFNDEATEEEIYENLKRIKEGRELTMSLHILLRSPIFRKKYEELCNIEDDIPKGVDFQKVEKFVNRKIYKYEYEHRPEVIQRIKEYRKEYDQRDYVKRKNRIKARKYWAKKKSNVSNK
jgi:hypothetical protein